MAFVNERISGDDRKNFDFDVIKRPPLYREPIDPSHWTIDRSRNAFLIWTLGGREDEQNAEHFALWLDGNVVYAKLLRDSVGHFSSHVQTTWRLQKLMIPAHRESTRGEIIEVLRDALAAYKVGSGVRVASHEAKFDF
ncbi:hypothetical protein LZ009_11230 [Ramlibacter sp. XY19]|uniref:hypothetical protein n=1 Tax=Ramlibacter paludis TaxID=2908000 RepID=UPI0023DA1589|nr:hypothetical protein [Ramlibacter paludis]MCG2593349.1 hypothetical protein [Ramlibacter paludis]